MFFKPKKEPKRKPPKKKRPVKKKPYTIEEMMLYDWIWGD